MPFVGSCSESSFCSGRAISAGGSVATGVVALVASVTSGSSGASSTGEPGTSNILSRSRESSSSSPSSSSVGLKTPSSWDAERVASIAASSSSKDIASWKFALPSESDDKSSEISVLLSSAKSTSSASSCTSRMGFIETVAISGSGSISSIETSLSAWIALISRIAFFSEFETDSHCSCWTGSSFGTAS